jgi:PAS domain S-box-containing protein
MNNKKIIIWLGLSLAALSWLFEAMVHVFVFHRDNLVKAIFVRDPHEIVMRLPAIFFIVVFSIYAQYIITKRKQAEQLLQKGKDELEITVADRTAELQTANERLQNDIAAREQAEAALKRSYEFTKTVIDSMNDAIAVINVDDFKVVSVNKTFLKEYAIEKEEDVIGKTCYEVTHKRHVICAPPDDICPLKDAVETGEHRVVEHVHYGEEATRLYVEVSATPIRHDNGKVTQVIHVTRDITARKEAEEERERLIRELQKALSEIKTLSGMLPICANCKKIRDDKGYWNQIEVYISEHSEAEFSHGICPECKEKLYPGYARKGK